MSGCVTYTGATNITVATEDCGTIGLQIGVWVAWDKHQCVVSRELCSISFVTYRQYHVRDGCRLHVCCGCSLSTWQNWIFVKTVDLLHGKSEFIPTVFCVFRHLDHQVGTVHILCILSVLWSVTVTLSLLFSLPVTIISPYWLPVTLISPYFIDLILWPIFVNTWTLLLLVNCWKKSWRKVSLEILVNLIPVKNSLRTILKELNCGWLWIKLRITPRWTCFLRWLVQSHSNW